TVARYSSGNTAGKSDKPSAKEWPSMTLARTPMTILRMRGRSVCSETAVNASSSGRPERTNVEICRVSSERSPAEMPRRRLNCCRSRRFSVCRTSLTESGRRLWSRSIWRTARAVSPSRTPLRSRPVASTAVYSKAPKYFALVLARHAQHFFDRRGARQYLRTTVVADAVGHGPCVLLQILLTRAVVNHRTHRVIDHHQLVNAGAASEALIAVGAGAIERRGRRRSRQIQ